jgi:hypothetical protein
MNLEEENKNEITILTNQNDIQFIRIKENHYNLKFNIKNENIILFKIINFDLLKLIYDLNTDIYEKTYLEKINDNEAIITILMKHFFEDIGLPQRFTHSHVYKTIENNKIIFKSILININKPKMLPENAEQMPLEHFTIVGEFITDHSINFDINIIFNNKMNVLPFIEKMVGIISNKIFKRLKQFIENIQI